MTPLPDYSEIIDVCQQAEELIGWLRTMTIEGQIQTTDYALERKPNDCDAQDQLCRISSQIKRALQDFKEHYEDRLQQQC